MSNLLKKKKKKDWNTLISIENISEMHFTQVLGAIFSDNTQDIFIHSSMSYYSYAPS